MAGSPLYVRKCVKICFLSLSFGTYCLALILSVYLQSVFLSIKYCLEIPRNFVTSEFCAYMNINKLCECTFEVFVLCQNPLFLKQYFYLIVAYNIFSHFLEFLDLIFSNI